MLPWRIINHVQADQITKVPTTDVPLDLYLSVFRNARTNGISWSA